MTDRGLTPSNGSKVDPSAEVFSVDESRASRSSTGAAPQVSKRDGYRRIFGWRVLTSLAGIVGLLVAGGIFLTSSSTDYPAAEAEMIPYDGRSPRIPPAAHTRVLVALSRPALGQLPAASEMDREQQRDYLRSLQGESDSLISTLKARGIPLDNVRTFTKVWNGFAATLPTAALAKLTSSGVRVEHVRRFYPASSEPAVVSDQDKSTSGTENVAVHGADNKPAASAERSERRKSKRKPTIALLDSGVDFANPKLRTNLTAGYDVLTSQASPHSGSDPRNPGRTERSGTTLASILARSGEKILPIRISGFQAAPDLDTPEVFATTDRLLEGLERAVDPDDHGHSQDHVRMALVGVNAPYAGFSDPPEATAIRAATQLGTLVVVPAGNEGKGRVSGTVGSPGAVREAVTVGGLSDRSFTSSGDSGKSSLRRLGATVGISLRFGNNRIREAILLGGETPDKKSLPLTRWSAPGGRETLERGVGRPKLQGKAVVMPATNNPSLQAARAGAGGAELVILVEPRLNHVLPAIPAGRVNVPVVGVTGPGAKALLKARGKISIGKSILHGKQHGVGVSESPFSSRGPTSTGDSKPDLLATGVAVTPGGSRGHVAVVGGTAVAAANVAVFAARIARTRPKANAFELRRKLIAAIQADSANSIRLAGTSGRQHQGLADMEVPLGNPQLIQDRQGKTVEVRFRVGSFSRGDQADEGTSIRVAHRLDLELRVPGGRVVHRLTPVGGAKDLLPGEYGYRLRREILSKLPQGRYYFQVTAKGLSKAKSTRRRTAEFTIK